MLNVGGLFDGAGLLAYGLHLAGLEHAWLCEWDPWRRDILAQRFPGIPVYDDVRHVGAANAVRVDVIAGGFPCKGASTAGKLNGFDHPETVLWREMFRAVRELRPRYVLIENVANLLALHDGAVWGEVLGDLASIGYDVTWDCIPAAAVGAPHLRDRLFAVATDTDGAGLEGRGRPVGVRAQVAGAVGVHAEAAPDPDRSRENAHAAPGAPRGAARERTRVAADTNSDDGRGRATPGWNAATPRAGDAASRRVAVEWGDYESAIRRWEAVQGPAPEPLVRRVDDGLPDMQRVRSRVDRSRLSALGDGVQVQAGYIAGRYILDLESRVIA